ncbi:MAG: aminopeptidase P family protein [Boseongicola sp. SB0664_bin_43]|uniref:Aminopeptidase P family protein n=1 Tax=Boseongicola sp. SB0664_bin_43 TaxID=2604844 RepID=A0A6B0Y177_9RHOB|nr:aminopeptidase P family protein [Boseongicola sp. SB0664_bin_43]
MFQTFDATASPEQGPPRLAALREVMAEAGFDAFLVPRADRFQGEFVAPADERLAWLTGFTGSAGLAVICANAAAMFVDGRYRLQVRDQDADDFTTLDPAEVSPAAWLTQNVERPARVGFDPWLHTVDDITKLTKSLGDHAALAPSVNLVDRIWTDRPSAPIQTVRVHPLELSGEGSSSKRERLAQELQKAGQRAAILTLPESICWLLNIRGDGIPRSPVVHAFAILHDTGRVSLFSSPEKFKHLGPDPNIDIEDEDAFGRAVDRLEGPVRVDGQTAPWRISEILEDRAAWDLDPCFMPKACKNDAEVSGMQSAHLRDGAAMVEFLAWFDKEAPKGGLTEISAARALEGFRAQAGDLLDISFDTISGSGPNAAIIHYRVSEQTDRKIKPGELYLVDSGGQYIDGTTDVTRTLAVGEQSDVHRDCYTRVLQGLIAISLARFPSGRAGRDIDALARAPLWRNGLDYDHGTGHGVGACLNVHEGPQRISPAGSASLEPGMILSNEPGHYRPGEFGIRIENLLVVRTDGKSLNDRDRLCFQTLTYVPFDRRLIDTSLIGPWERNWIDAYHSEVREKIGDLLSASAREWLDAATKALD